MFKLSIWIFYYVLFEEDWGADTFSPEGAECGVLNISANCP